MTNDIEDSDHMVVLKTKAGTTVHEFTGEGSALKAHQFAHSLALRHDDAQVLVGHLYRTLTSAAYLERAGWSRINTPKETP